MPTPLPRRFYSRSPETVARELLGKLFVRNLGGKVLIGKIVEVEAYLAAGDAAAHGFKGVSGRNRSLFKDAGHAYVHTMRQYSLLDIVTETEGVPSSVLIRAIEPLDGIDLMQKRRGSLKAEELANGPGKFCMAFGITKEFDGEDVTVTDAPFYLAESSNPFAFDIGVSGRVGISRGADAPLRFWIQGNPFVSRMR